MAYIRDKRLSKLRADITYLKKWDLGVDEGLGKVC